jgi:ABC-type glycerol-3-phosphate transport system permease component
MRRSKISFALLVVAALFFTFISIAPVLWMLIGAFKTDVGMMTLPPEWPDFTFWDNFETLFNEFGHFIGNSMIVTLGATVLAIAFAVPTAFGLVIFRLKYRNALSDWILSTRMMPPIAAAVPLFIIFNGLGMLNSIPALVIVYAGFNLPFAIWVTMSFMKQLPKELIEATRLEGATWFEVLIFVAIPLSLSGIATVATFVFIFAWNEFLLALFLSGTDSRTLPVVISSFIGTGRVYWANIAAAAVIQCIPPVVFAFVMQRHVVSGMTMGAVKD